MARLRHQELNAFSQALLELYSPGPHADFPDRVSAILRRCLSFDLLAYHEIVDNQNQRTLVYPDTPFDMQAFETYLDQHPTWNAFTRDHMESCVKISDFLTRNKWERTDLYNYVFRPFAIRNQLAFITLGELPQLGLAGAPNTTRFFRRGARDSKPPKATFHSSFLSEPTLFPFLRSRSSFCCGLPGRRWHGKDSLLHN